MRARVPVIVVHGGAGARPRDEPDQLRAGLEAALSAGWAVLRGGGRALDAVEAAVRVLEDHPRFNAGRGAVLTAEGRVELDASIMEGDRLGCGAVAAVSSIANPISLARRVLADGRHILLVGEGALRFARAQGIAECDPASLVTERARRRWLETIEREHSRGGSAGAISGPPQTKLGSPSAERGDLGAVSGSPQTKLDSPEGERGGTVGAVALDRHGTIAAATSTGGIAGQLPGRVGDSALIGCGTYAESTIGGVSCTGDGEAVIRTVLGLRALDLLKEADDPEYAAKVAVDVLVEEGRGQGGLILLDWRGRIGFASSTPFMPVGWMAPALGAPALSF
jgi:L-asparaginase / beta-aspartyl-peptidase